MPTVLLTGATGGLGLATAKALRQLDADVVCAGRHADALLRVCRSLDALPWLVDLRRPAMVREAAQSLPHIDAIACIAGVQIIKGQTQTEDGLEETFAVNHLSHIALVDSLLNRDRPPSRVVFIGSATHDPDQRTGTPPPLDSSIEELARPAPDSGAPLTAGMRRYVTTRQLAIATSAALAREHPEVHVAAFDPGLMPGTGLARQYPAAVRVLWTTLAKGLTLLPFVSTPAASGGALATVLTQDPPPAQSGSYLDYRLRETKRSRRAADVQYQDESLRASRKLLAAL